MAENKQYIEMAQENGAVMISLDVISTIVCRAVTEVEGVIGFSSKPGTDIVDILSKKNSSKGVRIEVSESDELSIECNVVINYGQSVVTVASAIQEAVSSAVESMTGIKVVEVNVNVCGIARQ